MGSGGFNINIGGYELPIQKGPRSGVLWINSNSTSLATHNVNALYEGVAFGFRAPEDVTISEIVYRNAATLGSPGTLKCSLQGRATGSSDNGEPNGTVLGGGSPAEFDVTSHSTGWNRVTLDNSYAVSRGDELCVVVQATAGTWDGSNYAVLGLGQKFNTNTGSAARTYNNIGGSLGAWSATSYWMPAMACGDGTRDYWGNAGLLSSIGWDIDANGSSYEVALKFTVPNDNITYTLQSFGLQASNYPSGGDFTWTLYEGGGASDTTATHTTGTIDEELSAEAGLWMPPLDTAQVLTNGTTYRAAVKHNSTTNLDIYSISPADATAAALEQTDWNFEGSRRTTGNWTDGGTSSIPLGILNLSISASGGGATNPPAIIGDGG